MADTINRTAHAFLDAFAELIAPTRCGGCDGQDALFCARCRAWLEQNYDPRRACPRCGAPFGALVCTECAQTAFAFSAACVLGVLDGPLARAIVMMKDRGEERLATVLAQLLAQRVWPGWADAVAFVPVSPAALRARGFDQGRAVAWALAAALDLPLGRFLIRPHSTDLRSLDREQRRAAVAESFKPGPDAARVSRYPHVLLVDDVFTTGATTDACARLLLEAGAAEVRVACLARTM